MPNTNELENLLKDSKKIIASQDATAPLWRTVKKEVEALRKFVQGETNVIPNITYNRHLTKIYSTPEDSEKMKALFELYNYYQTAVCEVEEKNKCGRKP